MMESILFYGHYTLLLCFGIALSALFAGITLSKRNLIVSLCLFLISGGLLLISCFHFGEEETWKLYPLLVHLPTAVTLCVIFHCRVSTMTAAITTAYLCCQPAKWMGLIFEALINQPAVGHLVQILVLTASAIICYLQVAPVVAEIYNKETQSIHIFSSIPMVYYLFDYVTRFFPSLWGNTNPIVAEFLPFFLSISFMVFCFAYYKQYESRAELERRESVIKIMLLQQSHEIEAIRQSAMEVRLLRHDMRHLLNSLSVILQQGNHAHALKLIEEYEGMIDGTSLHRYCSDDTLNCVLKYFETKCLELQIEFQVSIEVDVIHVDEISFLSIVSNALENAINAQKKLPTKRRRISLMIKETNDKLLLSVGNPYAEKPHMLNDVPAALKIGHGYGTQSIRYMTEKLGGKCQFLVEQDHFLLRIIL